MAFFDLYIIKLGNYENLFIINMNNVFCSYNSNIGAILA